MRPLPLLGLCAVIVTGGCNIKHPQTAQEFRIAAPDAQSAKIEKHVVNRSLEAVTETFRKKAAECLEVAIRTTSRGYGAGPSYTTTYTPTVIRSAARTELHVQQHIDNVVKVSEEPKGGYFLLVVDAESVDKNKTRLTFYRPAWAYDTLVNSVRNWASGENMGCPDMTKP